MHTQIHINIIIRISQVLTISFLFTEARESRYLCLCRKRSLLIKDIRDLRFVFLTRPCLLVNEIIYYNYNLLGYVNKNKKNIRVY